MNEHAPEVDTAVRAATYIGDDGTPLPLPPLADLRDLAVTELPKERADAAEAWWIHADHPGFGMDAEHTVSAMRRAGFTELETRSYLLEMIAGSEIGPVLTPESLTSTTLTDVLVRLVHTKALAEGFTVDAPEIAP